MNLSPGSITVFLPAPGTVAIIVTREGQEQSQREQTFKDAHAALDWAIDHKAGLVYTPEAATPTQN